MATTSFSDHRQRRIIALGKLGDDCLEIALAVAELEHRRRGRVDLEDSLRREQGPAPARLVALEPDAAGEMRFRLESSSMAIPRLR